MWPMHTAGLALTSIVPAPDSISQRVPPSPQLQFNVSGQDQGFRDANSDRLEGIVFPEGSSAFYMSNILQELSSPLLEVINLKTYDRDVWESARITSTGKWRAGGRYSTLGIDFM